MTTPKNILRPRTQRQDSLDDQLRDLIVIANHQGCYDAADWLSEVVRRRRGATFLHGEGNDSGHD